MHISTNTTTMHGGELVLGGNDNRVSEVTEVPEDWFTTPLEGETVPCPESVDKHPPQPPSVGGRTVQVGVLLDEPEVFTS
jgi:hypothetical protein